MKIYHNALSEELLQDCWNEVGKLSKESVWASSCLGWEKNLMIGLSGSTLHTLVPQYNRDRIIESISKYYPDDTEYSFIQYYIWQPNSGISRHNDESYNTGSTIYLNERWDKNMGGLFVWEEDDNEIMKTIAPKRNMMIINDKSEYHFVTSISPFCKEYRVTIQIWTQKEAL